ncbi:MAG: methyltransferase domain-containing protein [Chloroflexi bacterium]|nr:MAG: methyltransferase domain-containing protein [Chloroflexota bacterium]TMF75824.1 MAG: methyltransferase domain-containing protein [Chloroflexota bacterium]TMG43962.1 MAG: methyltransferase domain-containing protein [Chloroflexota bacterium]
MALMDPDASDEMVDHLVDFFDRVAPVYDTWAGGQHGRVATRLVDLATPSQNEQVLDVGTGTGLVANLVAPRVNPGLVIGVDLSENMLSIARANKAKNVQFVGMAAEHLVFRPATFDLVTMGQALAYFADPTTALAEANRVLRPGGRLAVSCQRRSLNTRAQDLFFQGLVPLARRHYLSLPRYSSERSRFGEPDVLPEILATAGFDLMRMTEMVTGGRTHDAREWTELMAGAGPLPYTLIRSLGPRYRNELEAEVEAAMASLGDPDEAFRYHHSYVLAVARKR